MNVRKSEKRHKAVRPSSLHGKKKDSMIQEIFARLVFYNYTSLITRDITVPEGKQVNFSAAVLVCRKFFKKNSISPTSWNPNTTLVTN